LIWTTFAVRCSSRFVGQTRQGGKRGESRGLTSRKGVEKESKSNSSLGGKQEKNEAHKKDALSPKS